MTDNDKSSEIAERVRRKIAEELLRRGLDPSVIFPAGKNAVGKDSRPEPKIKSFAHGTGEKSTAATTSGTSAHRRSESTNARICPKAPSLRRMFHQIMRMTAQPAWAKKFLRVRTTHLRR